MKRAFVRLKELRSLLRVIKGKESAMSMKTLISSLIMSAVRHLLTAAGAVGIVLPADAEVTVAAFVSLLVGIVLSVVDKVVVAKLKSSAE